MASYRSMPAENPFLSSDEEVLYDDADGYGDEDAGVYDSKDVPMGVAADDFEISDTEEKMNSPILIVILSTNLYFTKSTRPTATQTTLPLRPPQRVYRCLT